ncbi:hypothetical protein [Streptomyces rochei]|uniref:hypothetical protein n=1 Tax=Streptomyces rochei TaxID=1928 RepID=UPI0036F4DC2C
MDAKEKISTALQASQFTAEQAASIAEELYDFVAHELAARVQAEYASATAQDMGRSHFKRPYLMGLSKAIKLIEPPKEGQ